MAYQYVVQAAVEARCAPGWSWDSVVSPFPRFNLWLVAAGRGWVTSGAREFELSPGACFVFRREERQLGRHDPDNPLTVPFALFDILEDGRPVDPGEEAMPLHRHVACLPFFRELLARVIACRSLDGEDAGKEAERWLEVALREYRRQPAAAEPDAAVDPHKRGIEELCDRIERENLFTLKPWEMARQARLSGSHFTRLFKARTGMTPGEYVIHARIEKAKNLLRFSSQSLGSVAAQLGYGDIYSFSRQFKGKTGKAPSAWRAGGGSAAPPASQV